MGNNQSRTLSDRQHRLDQTGHLYKTIGEILEVDAQAFDGAYANARKLRRGGSESPKPEMYERILRKALKSTGVVAEVVFEHSGSLLSLLTENTRVTSSAVDDQEKGGHVVEALTSHEKKVKPKAIVDGSAEISRIHLLPKDQQCKIYWGKVAELLSGADDKITSVERDAIVEIIGNLKSNRFVLDGPHNEIFDNLNRGIVIPVPLMSQAEVAAWKNRQPYQVLMLCDSANTYKDVEKDTDHPHVKWATEADLDLATELLSTNTKILADSLCQHWGDYHSKRASPTSARHKALDELRKELGSGSRHVSVPKVKTSNMRQARLNPWNYRKDAPLKLYKIDYGLLCKGDMAAAFIPDPWLLAIKAAVNWSAYSHKKNLKLLPACSDCDRASSVFSGYWDVSDACMDNAHVQNLAKERLLELRGQDIDGLVVQYVSDDDESDHSSVSSLGSEEAIVIVGGDGDKSENVGTRARRVSLEIESM